MLEPAASSSDLVENEIFRLPFVKVNVSVLIQSLRLFPITICRLPFVPLLHLVILSLFLTVREALSHPSWHSVMVDEMQALDDNGTWDLVPLPTSKKSIGCYWVFAVKFNFDGSVTRLKVHLVAKVYA